jgi:hypothetical protein
MPNPFRSGSNDENITSKLCRSISYRIARIDDREMGFVFEPFFSRELRTYEATPEISFGAFLIQALDRLRAERCGGS